MKTKCEITNKDFEEVKEMENITINVEDLMNAIAMYDDGNDGHVDLAEASIELAKAAFKMLDIYQKYFVRSQKLLKYHGEAKTMMEWAKETGIPYYTLRKRINDNGWSVAEALSTPVSAKDSARNFHKTVTVMQYNYKRELMQTFPSMREASRQLGIEYATLNTMIEGMDELEQVAKYGFYLKTPVNSGTETETVKPNKKKSESA